MNERRTGVDAALVPEALSRSSFVPLYYQLQEVIKEQIESGVWRPGDALPSEPDLARRFGVSRVVVRQALAILEDDRQIKRIKGRGTFVARPKFDARAGGLSRLLLTPRPRDVAIHVLDLRRVAPEKVIREHLAVERSEPVLRLTTSLTMGGIPISVGYSFFPPGEVQWLEDVAHPGRAIPRDLVLADHGVQLAHSRLGIETSQCGQFEADRFGIPVRSPVFLVLCTEFRDDGGDVSPFEVARVEYRGDLLQFRLQTAPTPDGEMSAEWSFSNERNELLDPGTVRSD